MIHGSRVVPISEIYNDANRRTCGVTKIVETIVSNIRRVGATTSFERADVQARPGRFIDDRRKRVFAQIVMQLSPSPLFWVGPLEVFHFLISGCKTGQQQVIALLSWIFPESGLGIFQRIEQSGCVRTVKRVRCSLAEYSFLEGPAKMTAEPDLIQGRLC